MKNLLLTMLASVGSVAAAAPAQAAYNITFAEVDGNIQVSGSGSLDLAGLVATGQGTGTTTIYPGGAAVLLGDRAYTNADTYQGKMTWTPWGTTDAQDYIPGTGQRVGVLAYYNTLVVPTAYRSGTELGVSTLTLANATFASLGLKTGSYGVSWNGASTPQITINIGSTGGAVPEPATWGLMIAGFGAIGVVMRRRPPRLAVAS